MKSGRRLLQGVVTAGFILALSGYFPCEGARTFAVGMKITQIQATRRTSGPHNVEMDPGISKSMANALKKKYGTRYKSYTKTGEETRELKIGGRPEGFNVGDGKILRVKVMSFRPNPPILYLQIQVGFNVRRPSVRSGAHLMLKATKNKNPIIVVVSPKLLRATKE